MKMAERKLLVRANERVDDLQNGRWIIQDPDRFCFGMDAVLLAWYARGRKNDKVLDLCSGNGIIPLLLEARQPQIKEIHGLEIQEASADLARRSIVYNGLEEKIHIEVGDVKEASAIYGKADFSLVTCNPPYMTGGHGLKNPKESKAIARHEILCSLEDVVCQAAKALRDKGRFVMVHRPFRLGEIIYQMERLGLKVKRMRFVHSYSDREPSMVLLEGVKGAKPRVTVEKPLIIFDKAGLYSPELEAIYGWKKRR